MQPSALGVELVAREELTEPITEAIAEAVATNDGAEDIPKPDKSMPPSTTASSAADGTDVPQEANAADARASGGTEGHLVAGVGPTLTSISAVPDNEEEEGLCVVCFDAPAGTRLEPCGHSYFCQNCAARYGFRPSRDRYHRRYHHPHHHRLHQIHHHLHHHLPPPPRFRTCPLCRAPLVLAMNGTPWIEGVNDAYNHQEGAAAAAGRSQEVLSDS